MKTLFNIIICGHNEILKRYNINEIKKDYGKRNSIAVYNCKSVRDRVKLLLMTNKYRLNIIDNFDSLTKLQLKIVMKKSGCINLLVTRLSNQEVFDWFCKRNCIELYIQLFPYLLNVDDTKKSLKKFTIVRKGLFEYMFK